MLKISAYQMHKLAVAGERQFVESMIARYGEFLTSEGVDACLARARGYGLRSKGDLNAFLTLCAESGADFDSRPETAWIARDLADPTIGPPPVRLRWVRERKAFFAATVERNRAAREEFLR